MKLKDYAGETTRLSVESLKKIKYLLKVALRDKHWTSRKWFIAKELERDFGLEFDDPHYHSQEEINGEKLQLRQQEDL